MPVSNDYAQRLERLLPGIVGHFGTPFHLYDEKGIRETGQALIEAFSGVEVFREYFAVKALPNPAIMQIMHDMGFGNCTGDTVSSFEDGRWIQHQQLCC